MARGEVRSGVALSCNAHVSDLEKFMIKSTSIRRHLATRRSTRGRGGGLGKGVEIGVDAYGISFGEDQTHRI